MEGSALAAVAAARRPASGHTTKGNRSERRAIDERCLCDLLEAVGGLRNRAAFDELFQRVALLVKRLLVGRGAGATVAEEITQETMLLVWRHAATFDRRRASVMAWVFAIARNKHLDLLRATKRSDQAGPEPREPQVSADVEEILSSTQTGHLLRDAIRTLPWEQEEMLRKAFYEDKSHSDIASERTLPLGTVKSRIRLALTHLRTRLPLAELR